MNCLLTFQFEITILYFIFFYNLHLHALFQDFFMLDIKTSNIFFFYFPGLTQVNLCAPRLDPLAGSTLRLGLIIMIIILIRL